MTSPQSSVPPRDIQWARRWHIVRRFMLRCSYLLSVLLATGCTSYVGWRPLDQFTPVKPQDVVWIWSGSTVNQWEAVIITQDSVSGVPHEMSLCGDACRRTLPRTQVDSMKVAYIGHHTTTKKVVVVVGVATAAVIAALIVEFLVCSLVRELTGETC